MALLSLVQFYSAVVFDMRGFPRWTPHCPPTTDLFGIAMDVCVFGQRQHQDTLRDFSEWSGGIISPPVLPPRGSPCGERENVNETGDVKEMCQQTLENESNAVYKPSQQKLHKPQWRVWAHRAVYRARECFLRDLCCGLMDSDGFIYIYLVMVVDSHFWQLSFLHSCWSVYTERIRLQGVREIRDGPHL